MMQTQEDDITDTEIQSKSVAKSKTPHDKRPYSNSHKLASTAYKFKTRIMANRTT